jgi:uncharacterized protein (TIGR02391 family)
MVSWPTSNSFIGQMSTETPAVAPRDLWSLLMDLARLQPDVFVELPVERRGVELLRAITASEGRGFFSNRRNILIQLQTHHWEGQTAAAERAFSEAFDWLQLHGLVSREPSQDGPDWFFVTDRGWDVAENDQALPQIAAAERLAVDLHPRIAERVRAQFLLGEAETAAFIAMREVEIRVRELSGAAEGDIGVSLMQQAFGETGPLADPQQEGGEQQATMALFWGAIGVFKNPSSHREVDYEGLTLASEVILFADLLLRLLDRIQGRLES